jgi:hypothetical protein
VRLENWARDTITVVPQESEAPALVFSVQRWLWSNQGLTNSAACLLDLSPAFLEDCGVLPLQSSKPSVPQVSLAQDVSLSVPSYNALASDLTGILGLQRTPQPAWVAELKGVPLLTFSVRLFGATGTQTFDMEDVVFFDAGTGVSPKLLGNIAHSTPDLRTTNVPQSTFEICLLVLNWAN